jgi:hypothetical protein
MARHYIPVAPFNVYIGGVKAVFHPDHVDRTSGLPGYPEDQVPKELRGSFRAIDIGDADGPVEQATAAPGEKRATKPRAGKGDATVTPAPVTTKTRNG